MIPETITLDGVPFKPYAYYEEADKDGLVILFRVRLEGAETEQLRSLMQRHSATRWGPPALFPVVRHGVSSDPVEMYFVQVRWSGHNDVTKFEVHLLERMPDDLKVKPPCPTLYETINLTYQSSETSVRLGDLLSLLVEKGVLSKVELSALLQGSESRYRLARHELSRVTDVDRIEFPS